MLVYLARLTPPGLACPDSAAAAAADLAADLAVALALALAAALAFALVVLVAVAAVAAPARMKETMPFCTPLVLLRRRFCNTAQSRAMPTLFVTKGLWESQMQQLFEAILPIPLLKLQFSTSRSRQ
jgi:hypothetical protein